TVGGWRSSSFVLHQFGARLRYFFHKKTHFRMTGFRVHSNALVPQLCGGNRANGSDGARQATNHVLPKIHLLGDLKQVPYLDGLDHEEDIDLAESNCVDGLAQWSRVFRQAPKDRTWQAA